jgi:hypothetical protein
VVVKQQVQEIHLQQVHHKEITVAQVAQAQVVSAVVAVVEQAQLVAPVQATPAAQVEQEQQIQLVVHQLPTQVAVVVVL